MMSLVFKNVANDWWNLASDDLSPLDHWHSGVFWTTLITISPMLTTFNMPETQNRQTRYSNALLVHICKNAHLCLLEVLVEHHSLPSGSPSLVQPINLRSLYL